VVFFGALGYGIWRGLPMVSAQPHGPVYGVQQFASAFLHEYWLHFELTSVLLVVAVVAALAVIQVNRRDRGQR
jgi:NADH-quinone oxidoreductase subunit J